MAGEQAEGALDATMQQRDIGNIEVLERASLVQAFPVEESDQTGVLESSW